jgi:hypothetical protein
MLFRYTAPVEAALIYPAKSGSQFRWRRFARTTGFALLLVFSFALGRLAAPRTVYLLGTPIEPLAAPPQGEASPASLSSASHMNNGISASDEMVSICGAPTKSGKPCQRKVKGGGYCYQHRDKYGSKNANQKSQ